jgi:hypothetical protein
MSSLTQGSDRARVDLQDLHERVVPDAHFVMSPPNDTKVEQHHQTSLISIHYAIISTTT